MEKRPTKKHLARLKSQMILDLMDETTPAYKLHVLTNEYMAQISKSKKKRNGHK